MLVYDHEIDAIERRIEMMVHELSFLREQFVDLQRKRFAQWNRIVEPLNPREERRFAKTFRQPSSIGLVAGLLGAEIVP